MDARNEFAKVNDNAAITTVSISVVRRWFAKFQKGEFELDDKAQKWLTKGNRRVGGAESVGRRCESRAVKTFDQDIRSYHIDHSTVLR